MIIEISCSWERSSPLRLRPVRIPELRLAERIKEKAKKIILFN